MGYSRQQFYEIRRNYQMYGAEGLIDQLPGPKGPHPNRVDDSVEKAILDHCLAHPTHAAQRVADELVLQDVQVSAGGVRGVWSRHGLMTKHERLLRLEETARTRKLKLRRNRSEPWSASTRSFATGTSRYTSRASWWRSNTFFIGTLKGVGKVYLPQSNGYIERFHRTLLDEHLRIMGRTKWYESLEEVQQDLDVYLASYNRKRPHRGRGMDGRTPHQVFKAGLKKANEAAKARPEGKEEKKQAA